MKLYIIYMVILYHAGNIKAIGNAPQNTSCLAKEDAGCVDRPARDFPKGYESDSVAGSKETKNDIRSRDFNGDTSGATKPATAGADGVFEVTQKISRSTTETRRKIYSSQQATEFLVSSWNDISTWPKRNESSSLCEQDVERVIAGYLNNEYWALRFFDAWGKPGPSLLEGRSTFVGNYHQCRDSRAPELGTRVGFSGSYCVVTLNNLTDVPDSQNIVLAPLANVLLGTCLPSTCSKEEIVKLFHERIQDVNLTSFFKVASTDCRSEEKEYTTFTKVAIAIIVIVGALSVLGTTTDIIRGQRSGRTSSNQDRQYKKTDGDEQSKTSQTIVASTNAAFLERCREVTENVLVSFSVRTNWQKLTNTAPGSITVISGIRFFTMTWILIGHAFFPLAMTYASNAHQGVSALTSSRMFDVLFGMSFGVDSFFAISGFLVSYHWVKTVAEKGWKFNWLYFYFHRYWRLTPPYMAVVILVQGLQGLLVSGAMAPTSQPTDKIMCQNNWWLNLLYINNIFRSGLDGVCFGQSWSLAVDMQFYIVSPLLLIPFYYHRFAGVASCLFFAVAQFLISGITAYRRQWPLGAKFTIDWWESYYINFYTRIAPFAFGILAGYILSVNNGRVKMRPYQVATGWILAVSAGLLIMFGIHGDYTGNNPSGLLTSTLYYGVARGIWGASILWVVVACASGYGGPVNAFLSWTPFTVLGRLTYMAYLLQIFVLTIIFENLEQAPYMNYVSIFVFGIAGLFFTCIVSAVLTICLEFPMLNLERVLLGRVKH